MRKSCAVLSVMLLGCSVSGMGGVEMLGKLGFTDSVTVTPAKLIIKASANPASWGVQTLGDEWRERRDLAPGEEVSLLPDKAVRFVTQGFRVTLTPVMFRDQRKGFRVTEGATGSGPLKPKPVTAYIALGDTPTDAGEHDVEMTMDNGEWVRPEDSRNLELERLGWDAEWMIKFAGRIMEDQMDLILTDKAAASLWHTLVAKGFIQEDIRTHEDADGMEFLKSHGLFDSVAVTPAGLAVKVGARDSLSWEVMATGEDQEAPRSLEPGEEIAILPGQTVRFGARSQRLTFTPVSFKSQHKGFRVTRWHTGSGIKKQKPVIAYIALSDTPVAVGEADMEATLDDGEWVRPEDSRSLKIEKLGWSAETLVRHAERIMQDPEWMGRIFDYGVTSNLWGILVKQGLITQEERPPPPHPEATPPATQTAPPPPPDAAPQVDAASGDAQPEAQTKARTPWPYALIPPAFLAALYFMRKKRK